MSGFGRCIGVLSLVIAAMVAPARAQDGPLNLDAGKSAAQLFGSDCAICHKSPQGLARTGGILGLESFLREHYTASRESAAVLANYLKAVGDAPARARAKQLPKGDAKKSGHDASKTPAKPDEKKPADDAKSSDKSAEPKPAEAKPVEAKPVEAKPAEANPADAKPAETKSN